MELGRGLGVAAGVLVDAEAFQDRGHRVHKAHRQQHQVGLVGLLGAGDFDHLAVLELDVHGGQASDLALLAGEFLGRDRELAHAAFLVAGAGAQLHRPVGPDHGLVLLLGRLGHDFELRHALGAVAVAGAHAVAAGVATADHDHMLAVGAQLALELVTGVDLVLLRQELHREMDAVQVATGHRQIARLFGAAGQQHRVKVLVQLRRRDGFLGPVGDLAVLGQRADHDAGAELHAFGLHLLDAAVDVGLLHLEVGDAIAQQAADAVVLFKQCDAVAGARQLLRCRHAGRAGTDHGDFLAGLELGRTRRDPAFAPGAVDDGVLDGLDADGVAIDVQRAGGLAGCGADAAGEFGEVVGAAKQLERVLPVIGPTVVDQIVEIRNHVVHRATVVAERRSAVHAARALDLGLLVVQTDDEFLVMFDALGDRLVALFDTLKLHESCDFSHGVNLWSIGYLALTAWLELLAAAVARAACWRAWISPSARL